MHLASAQKARRGGKISEEGGALVRPQKFNIVIVEGRDISMYHPERAPAAAGTHPTPPRKKLRYLKQEGVAS